MNTRFAAAAALALGLALGPIARADDKGGSDSKDKEMTIHGIVSGVTVEGETVVDYKAKKAVEVEGAFLTVVGMPGHHHDASAGEKGDKAAGEKSAEAGRHHRAERLSRLADAEDEGLLLLRRVGQGVREEGVRAGQAGGR